MGMCDEVYRGLHNVSWGCVNCGLPNFASSLFDLTFYETSNSFDPLKNDISSHLECDISFANPKATSSPNRTKSPIRDRPPSVWTIPCTTIGDDENLEHSSFLENGNEFLFIHKSKQQRQDIPLKVALLNCQSIVGKKTSLYNMCTSTGSEIIIGTESWLNSSHLSTEIFPENYTVYRRDRNRGRGGGVFILVEKKSQQEHTSGSEGTDFNLGDIDWENNSGNPSASKPVLCNQLLENTENHCLEQQATEPTRVTEHSYNILDLFFPNNSSLINTTEVIPGISDHEAVYVEASLRPHKTPPLKRKVFTYNKANYEGFREELCELHEDLSNIPNASVDVLWTKFKKKLTSLMNKYIPTKILKEGFKRKPWIDRKVRASKAKLYTRMKKTGQDEDINRYRQCKRQCKSTTQKLERVTYQNYVNNLIEVDDPDETKPSKQKKFWNYLKSLRKDNTGISPLKDNGRLFNSARDKANILNRQYK
ncbi:uncharacterized protein LOC128549774 [Mercenaria mercenaria]|uniref:uncharacterized protein LOC128549774 n=1 Tax=Mercenaria mercenaria TaxID=6596 RepID=UPI00234E6351|nr:uncharacterized protein LOC128549774 [Mercenaria mercenaria]